MGTLFENKWLSVGAICVLLTGIVWGDSIRVETRRGRRSCGEETVFRVSLLDDAGTLKKDGAGVVTLDNFGPKKFLSEPVDFAKGNPRIFRGTLTEPGFLRLTVDVKGTSRDRVGKPYMYSVPYESERIEQGLPEPADFDEFWRETLAEAEKVPLDPQMRPEPTLSNEKWTMHHVSFASLGRRVNGWLSIPKGKGPWPVEMSIPASGGKRYATVMDGTDDRIKMMITIFPFELSPDEKKNEDGFDQMNAAFKAKYGVPRYMFAGMDVSREEYFFRPVLAGAVRAVRWLRARPEVDPTRFTYTGTSQGGCCGLALMALAPEVFASGRVNVPGLTDVQGWLKGRDGGWPHCDHEWFPADVKGRDARVCRVMPYFDGCNFAARVKCPVTVVAGLGDWVCPPACVAAAFNRMTAPGAELVLAYGGSHWTAPRIADEERAKERKVSP